LTLRGSAGGILHSRLQADSRQASRNPPTGKLGLFHAGLQRTADAPPGIPQPDRLEIFHSSLQAAQLDSLPKSPNRAGWGSFTPAYKETRDAFFPNRGRERQLDSPPPPSEPDWRISRIRLSSRWFTSSRIGVLPLRLIQVLSALVPQSMHSASVDDPASSSLVLAVASASAGLCEAAFVSIRPAV
jgi:hypothetical protein